MRTVSSPPNCKAAHAGAKPPLTRAIALGWLCPLPGAKGQPERCPEERYPLSSHSKKSGAEPARHGLQTWRTAPPSAVVRGQSTYTHTARLRSPELGPGPARSRERTLTPHAHTHTSAPTTKANQITLVQTRAHLPIFGQIQSKSKFAPTRIRCVNSSAVEPSQIIAQM